jgi:hypothetical protein
MQPGWRSRVLAAWQLLGTWERDYAPSVGLITEIKTRSDAYLLIRTAHLDDYSIFNPISRKKRIAGHFLYPFPLPPAGLCFLVAS